MVIQGCVSGVVDGAIYVEVDVLEFKRLGAGVLGARVAAFGRSQEPEEGHDDEVNDMGVDASADCM